MLRNRSLPLRHMYTHADYSLVTCRVNIFKGENCDLNPIVAECLSQCVSVVFTCSVTAME